MIITYNNPKTSVKITIEGTASELLPIITDLLALTPSAEVVATPVKATTPRTKTAKAKTSPRSYAKASPAKKDSNPSAGDLRAIFETLTVPNNLH